MNRRETLTKLLAASGLVAVPMTSSAAGRVVDMSRGRLPIQAHAGTQLGKSVKRVTVDGLCLADVVYADEVNGYVDHIRVTPEGFYVWNEQGRMVTVAQLPNTWVVEVPTDGFVKYRTTGYVLLEFEETAKPHSDRMPA